MEHLLTVEEIAAYLRIKPSTVYQWTHQGYIPHVKLGNLVRSRVSQADRWLDGKASNGRFSKRVEVL